MSEIDYELIRVAAASSMFAIAVFFDLKTREIRDVLWIVFGAVAAVIFVLDLSSTLENGLNIVLSVALASAISYGIYRSGLFGGADMLALITFAGILPLFDGSFAGLQGTIIHPFAPIVVLTNAVILSIAGVVFNVARNLVQFSRDRREFFSGLEHEPPYKKVLAIIVGHKSKDPKFAFPLEKTEDGKRFLDFTIRPAETADFESRKDVWVSSGVPYLVYLAGGFIIMVVLGDIISILFMGLLGP